MHHRIGRLTKRNITAHCIGWYVIASCLTSKVTSQSTATSLQSSVFSFQSSLITHQRTVNSQVLYSQHRRLSRCVDQESSRTTDPTLRNGGTATATALSSTCSPLQALGGGAGYAQASGVRRNHAWGSAPSGAEGGTVTGSASVSASGSGSVSGGERCSVSEYCLSCHWK